MNEPYFLDWEITSRCNFNCIFCHLKKDSEMSDKEILALSEKIFKSPFLEIKIGGGEPLLRKALLFKIAKRLYKQKSLVLVTNGYLITEKDLKNIKKYFSRVQISFYSSEKILFESLCQHKDAFEIIIENIKRLASQGIPVVLNSVLIDKNIVQINKIYEFAKEHQLKLRILRYRGKKQVLDKDLICIYEAYKDKPNVIFDDGFNFKKKESCGGIKNILALSSSGDVYPCTWLRDTHFWLGNLKDSSLFEILNSSKTNNIKRFLQESCKNCSEKCPFFVKDKYLKITSNL